jgi:hypothetical protein
MRALMLVATAALLVVPAPALAQRATGGRTSAPSPSPDAGRSRVAGGDARSRAATPATPAPPPRVPLGAPGSWAGGDRPRVLRPSAPGRPYRPAPYGSTPHGSRPHRPARSYPHVPYGYAPYGYAPYGFTPFGFTPFGYPLGYYGYDAYVGTSYRVPSVVVVTPAIIPVAPTAPVVDSAAVSGAAPAAPGGRLLVVGGGTGAPLLEVEAAGDSLLTLRWTGKGADVREVTLLLLDADRALLAAQTVRAAPYRAIFVRNPNAAFAGVAVTYAGGASTTTVVPLSPEGSGRD